METKRTILAVALCFAVAFAWQYLFMPKPKEGQPPPAASAAEAAGVSQGEMVAPAPVAAPAAVASSAATAGQPDGAETAVEIANSSISLEISSRGARIQKARLTHYKDVTGPKGKPMDLLAPASDSVGITSLDNLAPYWDLPYTLEGRSSNQAVFAWESPDGVRVEKTYTLPPGERYDVQLDVKLINKRATPVRDRIAVGLVRNFKDAETGYVFQGPAYVREGSLEEVDVSDLSETPPEKDNVAWAGISEKYFLMAAGTADSAQTAVRISAHDGIEEVARADLMSPELQIPPGGEAVFSTHVFIGPKVKDVMAPLGLGFEKAVNYGWFDPIGKPLLAFLRMIYDVVGNWGVAILILTTVVKLLFWPLSAKSYKSMARMRELQPKIQKLKDKHGDNKEKLNVELMQLYKTHKANPMGGCMPMLLQIPVFFALYKVLLQSIELRHAPFAFWLTDLSVPDPYYITPVVMGATMFLQQKLTPTSGMPEAQAKMMLYGLPVLFTFLFKDFPSGLVIYWLLNNVLSIAQQAMMMRGTLKNTLVTQ